MKMNHRSFSFLLLALVLACATCARAYSSTSGPGTLKMLVAYCPTDFTGAAAVVSIDVSTGAYTIDGTFKWPTSLVEGCVADYSPNIWYSTVDSMLWMDFTEDLGVLAAIDLASASIASIVHVKDPFFTGFETLDVASSSLLLGVSGTVTQSGLCSDGCFQFGTLATDGKYTALENILFKETADDTHLYDVASNTYYAQFGYQLGSPRCAPAPADECLVAIDAQTGNVTSAIYTPYEIYGFGHNLDAAGNVLVWANGGQAICRDPYNDFLFGTVNMNTAKLTPSACIPHNTTVDTDEWVGSFSLDDAYFATASGNSYGDPSQLLIFDVANSQVLINSQLAGLGQALKAAQELVFIWAVQFV